MVHGKFDLYFVYVPDRNTMTFFNLPTWQTWMCGGTLEIHPCSHVAHVFRKKSPYSWGPGGGSVLKRNSIRLAKVWLDDYAQIYWDYLNNNLVRIDTGIHACLHTSQLAGYQPAHGN